MFGAQSLKKCTLLGLLVLFALQSVPQPDAQYQRAVQCYEAKQYAEAAQLLEEVLPAIHGKQEEASAWFYRAYCSFYQKKYKQSAKYFKHFCDTFSKDPRVETATYMRGNALCLKSPDIRRDQAITQEAAEVLRSYLNRYPTGKYANEASVQLRAMNDKIAHKSFNNAKYYYTLKRYRAAVVSLHNFQTTFPNTAYNEEAAYLKADAQYRHYKEVESSEAQLKPAMQYCQAFLDSYPESFHAGAVGKLYANLLEIKETQEPNTESEWQKKARHS